MKQINNYIFEKLHIDKDMEVNITSYEDDFDTKELDKIIENYFNLLSDYKTSYKPYKGKDKNFIGLTIRIDFSNNHPIRTLQMWSKDICKIINKDTKYEWYKQYLPKSTANKCYMEILISKK